MLDDVTDSCDMFYGGEVIQEYADAAYSVRSGDKIVSEEVANEIADRECRRYVFHVSWRRVFGVCDCLARCFPFLEGRRKCQTKVKECNKRLTSKCQLDTKVSRTTSHIQRRKFSSVLVHGAIWNT